MREAFLSCAKEGATLGRVGLPHPYGTVCMWARLVGVPSASLSLRLFGGIVTTLTTNVPRDLRRGPESYTGKELIKRVKPDREEGRGRPLTPITGQGIGTQIS